MPSTAAVALALLVSLSPFLSEAPARGAITVGTSAGDASAGASFDVNGDGTLDPSEIDAAGPVQGDDLALDAGIESSRARGEQHTTVSAAGSSLSISSRGVCSGRTVLTGDHDKDLRRGGSGEAGRHIEFTLTQPGTFALSGSVATAPDPVQQAGGGDNRARFDLCCLAGGQPISIESDDAFRDTGGTIPVSASGPLPPGTYSIGAQCQSLAPRLVFVGGESRFDAPASSGSWTFSLTVSEGACGAGVACDEFRWVGGSSGAFADPHSWDPAGPATEGVPTFVDGVRSDKGIFAGGQHVVLDLAASGLAASRALAPRVPSRRMGELVIQGTRTLEPVGGTLILDDLDPTLPERSLRIGGGTLVLDQAGVTARHVSVGFLGDGGLEVVGPSGSFTSLGSFGVGADRSGSVTIRGGASVTTAETRIGEGDGGGAATITGAASTWSTGNLAVGFSAAAGLSIEDGAHVTSESAFVDCQLAQGPGVPGCTGLHGDARAEATVTGAAAGGSPSSWLLAGNLAIGPRGKVSVEGGAVLGGVGLALPSILVGPSGSDADCIAGHACLAVEDGTVSTAAISVGAGGAGKLRIGPAGRVSSLLGVGVAAQALARGELEVVGPSAASQLTANGLDVGTELGSHGEVRLENGAQASATGDSSVGTAGPGSFGLIEIAGDAAAPDATALHVTNANLELGADAAGPGDAIFGPTGELALSNGRLELENGALEIRRTGLVSGSGRIDEFGVSVVTNDGEIDCGVAIHGAYATGPDGVLECPQASLPGGAPQLSPLAASRFARALRAHRKPQLPPSGPFVVDGDATLDGTLVLQFLNGAAPRQGDAFELLDVSGSVTGAFANVRVLGLAPGAQFGQDLANGKFVLRSMSDATALPTVSLKARPTLPESKAKGAKVKFSRSGDTSLPLAALYRVRGTATNGVDYQELPGTLEIPAGKRSATLFVKPFSDGVPEGSEAVEIELLPGDDYAPSLASKVSLALVDPKAKKR